MIALNQGRTPASRSRFSGAALAIAAVATAMATTLLAIGAAPASMAASTSSVSAEVSQDSAWSGGWCGTIAVRNSSTSAIAAQSVSFSLPPASTLSSWWNTSPTVAGRTVTMPLPAWAQVAPGATYRDTGFCLAGSSAPPSNASVAWRPIGGGPTPTPTSTPSITPTPSPVTTFPGVRTPLATNGSRIVDANGSTVILQGVNWFGFETGNHAPHGLWRRDYKDMLAQISSLGFNTVRLPFSLEALRSTTTTGIDFSGGRNAALAGKTPQQVMDLIIDEAARQGLMVVLDNHSQADDGFMFDLWYGQEGFTEADWLATWQALATRYANRANVIGADLKNEPHGSATWGSGGPTDWRRAAELAGNAVLAKAPHWLIIVEGIEGPVAGGQQLSRHWWGGNLEGVRAHPVRLSIPNRLVYSPHEYGPGVYAQPWFSAPDMSTILADRWTKGFGYISDSGTAPILVGEFGAKNVGLDTVEGRWIRQFSDYLGRKGMSWTFWSWNPNSGDTGGILNDDWTTVNTAKMALLTSLIEREAIPYSTSATPTPTSSSTPKPSPTPTLTPTTPSNSPSPSAGAPRLNAVLEAGSTWQTGFCRNVRITNSGTAVAPSWRLTFALPMGTTVANSWNGTVTRSGSLVSVTPPTWASRLERGQSTNAFGFCATGTQLPTSLTVTVG